MYYTHLPFRVLYIYDSANYLNTVIKVKRRHFYPVHSAQRNFYSVQELYLYTTEY